jgi:hypothetical protein
MSDSYPPTNTSSQKADENESSMAGPGPAREDAKADLAQPWREFVQHGDLPCYDNSEDVVRIAPEKDCPESMGG